MNLVRKFILEMTLIIITLTQTVASGQENLVNSQQKKADFISSHPSTRVLNEYAFRIFSTSLSEKAVSDGVSIHTIKVFNIKNNESERTILEIMIDLVRENHISGANVVCNKMSAEKCGLLVVKNSGVMNGTRKLKNFATFIFQLKFSRVSQSWNTLLGGLENKISEIVGNDNDEVSIGYLDSSIEMSYALISKSRQQVVIVSGSDRQ